MLKAFPIPPEWAVGVFLMLMGYFSRRIGARGFPQDDDTPFPIEGRIVIFICGLAVFVHGLRRLL